MSRCWLMPLLYAPTNVTKRLLLHSRLVSALLMGSSNARKIIMMAG